MEKNWYPLIVFSFSRADCEIHAKAVQQLNFNTAEEQSQVELCFQNAVAVLPEEARDRTFRIHAFKVPQMCSREVGVHAS